MFFIRSPAGYCFVDFGDYAGSQKVMSKLNGLPIPGSNPVSVCMYITRRPKLPFNRPFPICLSPLSRNKDVLTSAQLFIWNWFFLLGKCMFIFIQNPTHFHLNGFAPWHVLKQRKWPILIAHYTFHIHSWYFPLLSHWCRDMS